jgi:hypothetical protein
LSGRLPTILALPWLESEKESHPKLALWVACDFVDVTLRLLIMAGLAEHRNRISDGVNAPIC